MELGAQLVYLGSARVLARSGQLHVMLTRCLARTLAGSWKPCPLLGSWRRYSLAKKVTRLIRYPVFKELTALYRGISLAVKRCLGRRLANRVMRRWAHVPIGEPRAEGAASGIGSLRNAACRTEAALRVLSALRPRTASYAARRQRNPDARDAKCAQLGLGIPDRFNASGDIQLLKRNAPVLHVRNPVSHARPSDVLATSLNQTRSAVRG